MIKEIRTIEVKSSKDTMIKAGELVDVVEVTPLTLTDRKIYNLLIDNAKQDIAKPVEHTIDKEKLRQSRRGNEQVDDSIMRLMGGIVQIKTERDGEPATIRVPLLGRNVLHDRRDGKFYYSFDPVLREIFLNSNVFARLKMDVMLNFQGKYGLALYEMIEKRINMRKTEDIFSIAQFRNLLGVSKGKLTSWHNLRTRAINPAVAEVNHLATDFRVEITGIKTGRSFNEIKVQWWRTSPDGEEAAIVEHLNTKIGRKARREGVVEEISVTAKLEYLLSDQAMESARKILLNGKNRIGLQSAIQQWEEAFANKEKPENPNGAFINFCKKIS